MARAALRAAEYRRIDFFRVMPARDASIEEEEFEPVARVEDIPVGEILGVVKSDGERICLANVDGEIMAVSDTCTHQDFSLSQGTLLPSAVIECAWHGARFSLRNGKVLRMPAEDPLPVYEVRVENGAIFVGGRKP